MANYCTYTDVEKKLQHIPITESSDPNQTEVTSFCTDITALMDARFRAVGITTQITNTELVKVVLPISVYGVCAIVMRSLELVSEAADVWQKLFDDAMKGIEKNPLILSTGTSEIDSAPGGLTGVTQPFSRGVKQW